MPGGIWYKSFMPYPESTVFANTNLFLICQDGYMNSGECVRGGGGGGVYIFCETCYRDSS